MRLREQRGVKRQGDAYGNGGGLGSVTPAIFRSLHFLGYRGSLMEHLGVSEFAQLSSLRYHMSLFWDIVCAVNVFLTGKNPGVSIYLLSLPSRFLSFEALYSTALTAK